MRVPPHFSHKTEELPSAQQATSRQGGFWAPLSWEKRIGNLWLSKLWPVPAPVSPVHLREPETHVLLFIPLRFSIQSQFLPELADSSRGSYCAVQKGCLFWNTWLQRSIWEIIQLKNTTNILSGNLTDCLTNSKHYCIPSCYDHPWRCTAF